MKAIQLLRIFPFLTCLHIVFYLNGQTNTQENIIHPPLSAQSIHFLENDRPTFISSDILKNEILSLPVEAQLLEKTSLFPVKHKKFTQLYMGYPILGSHINVHLDNNLIKSISGRWIHEVRGLTTQITISEEEALSTLIQFLGFEINTWNRHTESEMTLAYYSENDNPSVSDFRLVYQFDIEYTAGSESNFNRYYVSATSAQILHQFSLIRNCQHAAQGETVYSGNVHFASDQIPNGHYILHSCTQIAEVQTKKLALFALDVDDFINDSEDLFDDNNDWNESDMGIDLEAIDLHWGMERTLTYFYDEYNLASFDGQGAKVNAYMNWWLENAAYYPQEGGHFVFGGFNNDAAFTPLEVIVHEFSHGINDYSAGLINSGQSGALGEAWSDIFSKGFEAHYDPNGYVPNWLLGEEIFPENPARNMENPNEQGHPDCFLKQPFYDESGPIHSLAGIANRWFYVFSEGAEGINKCGNYYDVTGIGTKNAMDVAFNALTQYMGPNDGFIQAREWTLQATIDLFGNCSAEHQACMDAWYSVCVGKAFEINEPPKELTVLYVNECEALLSWCETPHESYEVGWRNAQGLIQYQTVTTNEILIQNLLPGTSFMWRVRASCAGEFTEWSLDITTDIPIECPLPETPFVVDVTVCSFTLGWVSSGASQYLIEYWETGTNDIQNITVDGTLSELCISGLLPNTSYEYKIRALCSCDDSEFSDTGIVELLICEVPHEPELMYGECSVCITVPANLRYWLGNNAGGSTLAAKDYDRIVCRGLNPQGTFRIALVNTCVGKNCDVTVRGPEVEVIFNQNDGTCDAPANLDINHDGDNFVVEASTESNAVLYYFATKSDPGGEFTYHPPQTSPYYEDKRSYHCYYEAKVSVNCSCDPDTEILSDWTHAVFTADDLCDQPNEFYVTIACPGEITLHADGGECIEEYEFRTRSQFSPEWTNYQSDDGDVTIPSSCTLFNWQVRVRCIGAQDFDEWIDVGPYISPCLFPIDVSSIVFQENCEAGHSLSWSDPNFFQYPFEVQIKESSDPDWSTAEIFALSDTQMEIVLPDGCYDIRIASFLAEDPLCYWYGPWTEYNFCIDCCNGEATPSHLISQCTAFFTAQTTGEILSIEWTFGDGESGSGTLVEHDYAVNGTYQVCMIAECGNGSSQKECFDVSITDCCEGSTSSFSSDINGCEVSFTSAATTDVVYYFWNFGQAPSSNEPNPIFTYSESGTFEVCLTTIFEDECAYQTCEQLTIVCCDYSSPTGLFCQTNDNGFIQELFWDEQVTAEHYQIELSYNNNACCGSGTEFGGTFEQGENHVILAEPWLCMAWRVRSYCNGIYGDWSDWECADPQVCQDPGYSCSDGIKNGNETGIDCGGPDCLPCQCDQITTLVQSYDQDRTIHAQDRITTNGIVRIHNRSKVGFYAGEYIEIRSGFEVVNGSELIIDIEECDDRGR